MSPPRMQGPPAGRTEGQQLAGHHAAKHSHRTPRQGQSPESTRPLPLTAASVEAISRADAAWFRHHPGEDVRYRPAGDREWPMLDRCPVPWPGASAVLMVEVTQLAPGVRTRRPYWVLGEAVA